MPTREKRRVVIAERDKGRFRDQPERQDPLGPVSPRPRSDGRISVPTGDRRHITKIREGKLDTSTCFSKARLATITVDPDVEFERSIESEKATQEALEELSREKDTNNAKVKEKPKGKRAPKPKAKKKPVAKAKVTKKAPVKRKPVKRKKP